MRLPALTESPRAGSAASSLASGARARPPSSPAPDAPTVPLRHPPDHALPRATPTTSRELDHHDRVRRDVIDKEGKVTLRHEGRLFHIGVGRTHARTPVILLVQDLDVRVVHAVTGELLRALTLDPARSYQPTGRRPGPTPRNPA